jgi:hypothetical protein
MRVGSFLVTLGITSLSMGCPLLEKSSWTDPIGPAPDVTTSKPSATTPAKLVRMLDQAQIAGLAHNVEAYMQRSRRFAKGLKKIA